MSAFLFCAVTFSEKHITTITFLGFRGTKKKINAFVHIGRSKMYLSKVPGLSMGMMMGTGAGAGFSLRPDWSAYALLCHWQSIEDAVNYFKNDAFHQRLVEICALLLQLAPLGGT